ncbi:MAG: NfeD family protein, partial [Beijerinckiaceae bacterium]
MTALGPYIWLIAGLVLATLEMIAPGVYLLWFGLAGILTGLLLFLWPLPFSGELIAFALFAVVTVAIGRQLTKKITGGEGEQPNLNLRGHSLIGRTVTLTSPIENGIGRISIDDTIWRVTGPDFVAGKRVKVVGLADGGT